MFLIGVITREDTEVAEMKVKTKFDELEI